MIEDHICKKNINDMFINKIAGIWAIDWSVGEYPPEEINFCPYCGEKLE